MNVYHFLNLYYPKKVSKSEYLSKVKKVVAPTDYLVFQNQPFTALHNRLLILFLKSWHSSATRSLIISDYIVIQ